MTDTRSPSGTAAPEGTLDVTLRPRDADEMRVLVAGDLCVSRPYALPESPWGDLAPFIAGHDLAMVGLECPLTTEGARLAKFGPALSGSPSLAASAAAGGFDAVTIANNHIMDSGVRGLEDTLSACAAAGLGCVGGGLSLAEACEPHTLELRGVRVAVLAVAEREFSIAGVTRPGAAPLDPWTTPAAVRSLRAAGFVVIVVLHGGNEHYPLPRPGLVAACRAIVDAGASAVLCHHTHVVGPWEVHGDAPILYGLGNYLFPLTGGDPPGWRSGLVVSLRVDAAGITGFAITAVEQPRGLVDVRAMPSQAARAWLERLGRLNAILADGHALESAWRRFCRERRPYTLAAVLGLSRPERRLLRAGVWPSWRLRRAKVPGLFDMVACDSHREVLETLLEEVLES